MRYLVVFLLLKLSLLAHPNVTINYRIFLKFNGVHVTDVGESWTFDKTTSKELMEKYHLKNVPLDKKRSTSLGKEITSELKELRYFTYISVDGKDLGALEASGFKAQIASDVISVAFSNHLPSPVDLTQKKISIEIKDEDESVITNLLEKNPVVIIGKDKSECSIRIKEIRDDEDMPPLEDLYVDDLPLPKKIYVECKGTLSF